jgi:hypothetical protein
MRWKAALNASAVPSGGRIPAVESAGGHQDSYQVAIKKRPATIQLVDARSRAAKIA